ncbi:MAG: acyl carrier protein [Bacteroidales bacterium]|nr:acyl carrier protein [Bacteroidales bacterium]
MSKQEIWDQVTAFMVDELEIEASDIVSGATLKEDLGIDSLEVVDVVVFVDETFGLRMKPEDFKDIETIDQFCDFIAQRVG